MITKVAAFTPVICKYCEGFGRTITLCTTDIFGNYFFSGKITPTWSVDRHKKQVVVPCRVCRFETSLDI